MDGGYLAAQAAVFEAQEALAALAQRRGVELTIFHGRGAAPVTAAARPMRRSSPSPRAIRFVAFFPAFTPVDELALLEIGSRPARRPSAEDYRPRLRTIPWVPVCICP